MGKSEAEETPTNSAHLGENGTGVVGRVSDPTHFNNFCMNFIRRVTS